MVIDSAISGPFAGLRWRGGQRSPRDFQHRSHVRDVEGLSVFRLNWAGPRPNSSFADFEASPRQVEEDLLVEAACPCQVNEVVCQLSRRCVLCFGTQALQLRRRCLHPANPAQLAST